MANISLVVAWIFVAVFAITVIIALLDLSQIIKIRDPARRKWLFGTLIVSVVMPVITFGTRILDGSAVAETAIKKMDANVERKTTVDPDQKPPKPTIVSPVVKDAPTIMPDNVPSVPASISAWMNANMPTRPFISTEFETRYPDCAAELRASVISNSLMVDAAQCRSDLEKHKAKYVSSYYSMKEAYDAAIIAKQTELSRRGLNPDEIEVYNFLQSENEDLNYGEGKSLKAIVAVEARINDDIKFCRERQ